MQNIFMQEMESNDVYQIVAELLDTSSDEEVTTRGSSRPGRAPNIERYRQEGD